MRSVLLAAATLVLVAGCSSSQPEQGPGPTTTTTVGTATTTTEATTGPTQPTASATSGGTAASACPTSAVKVTVPPPDDAGAGHVWYVVEVTNTSKTACTVHGFPGVSMVSEAGGHQVGAAAKRAATGAPTVTLQPGDSATAPLQYTQAGNYGDRCQLTPSAGFRIYLPDQTTASFAPQQVQGCANGDIVLLEISPFGTSP